MNIAVTTVDSTLESAVFCEFAKTPWLLINPDGSTTCSGGHHEGLEMLSCESKHHH
ncbi:MAG: hypothetical protein ACP5SH_12655 [Syntrophobacteraceae bacterium]